MFKIGQRIREARVIRELMQKDLAKILIVPANTLSQWETGVAEPSVEMILKICAALKCDANFLFGFSDFLP